MTNRIERTKTFFGWAACRMGVSRESLKNRSWGFFSVSSCALVAFACGDGERGASESGSATGGSHDTSVAAGNSALPKGGTGTKGSKTGAEGGKVGTSFPSPGGSMSSGVAGHVATTESNGGTSTSSHSVETSGGTSGATGESSATGGSYNVTTVALTGGVAGNFGTIIF